MTQITGNNQQISQPPSQLHVGIDVGSTTVKAVALNPATGEILFRGYERHHAHQADRVARFILQISQEFPTAQLRIALTGSGGSVIADRLGTPFIQEVVADAIAIRHLHDQTRTIIELGGQDAKIVFLARNAEDGSIYVKDMRMNGSCAGGTGAFIDEIAALLDVPIENFNALASAGQAVHSISGRCGVYAKTDIQPLLNVGVPKEDLALSSFHAIAKQTIGGLAQGCTIEAPVAFVGGPLGYNPALIGAFAERLNLAETDIIIPDHPDTIVAMGAALSLAESPANQAIETLLSADEMLATLEDFATTNTAETSATAPLFSTPEERQAFEARHALTPVPNLPTSGTHRAYLGIDAGSTTTKFALLDEDGNLLDCFYASNKGEPLDTLLTALRTLRERWDASGAKLEIIAVGTTGYGEELMAEALQADVHIVETVAHTRAATQACPDATFVLDIGGQDMKAIWLSDGIITDIVVNEACSSGCGSFLEGFASSLGIERDRIAETAFSSASPAALGSRCTVFMTSSVITEQRNGKTPADIMAGLCRSIIENLFTKVIRLSNKDSLGDRIVVQGGTFANDAVLRAFEDYLGKQVTRCPHPQLAGAMGVALYARDKVLAAGFDQATYRTSFIGLDAIDALDYTSERDVVCPHCANHCSMTLTRFSHGATFVTGNRCYRGEELAAEIEADVAEVDQLIAEATRKVELELDRELAPETTQAAVEAAAEPTTPSARTRPPRPANLFKTRERLLFKAYPHQQILPKRDMTIGLPRVLALWDTAPFWTTFFESLGFTVKLSALSSREMYESGLHAVMSDTVCFPGKLCHGHVRDLANQGVDCIFMPIITAVEPEGTSKHSESMCAVVKGYPMVIRSSDDPERQMGVKFETPLFHWHSAEDRERQLSFYLEQTFQIDPQITRLAIQEGDAAQASFRDELKRRGVAAIRRAEETGNTAVVLAARPYHNDSLVNHGLADILVEQGVSVLTADSLPGVEDIDLDASRLDIVNNYHARMLSSALFAANHPNLEYAQIVSFGCGHDAYLSDEITRLMKEASGKTPLILKVDESDATGPLRIRIRSFIETVNRRRAELALASSASTSTAEGATSRSTTSRAATPAGSSANALASNGVLPDPYQVKFARKDRKLKTVLVPNTSHAFSRLMAAVFSRQGLNAVPLEIGREEAIRLGKQYVHNDVCFPAQIVIGECLAALLSGEYDPDETAVGMAKYLGDCRLTHYSAMLRKALDDAGFPQVPIITNDDADERDLHPGFKFSLTSALRVAYYLPMIDAMEELLRKIRPYEIEPGSAERAFEVGMDYLIASVNRGDKASARRAFKKAIRVMNDVPYGRTNPRPKVLIVGEYLLNFHPGANRDIEAYLESNGFEVVEARMTDVIRKTYFYQQAQMNEYHVKRTRADRLVLNAANHAFDIAHDATDRIASKHPLYTPPTRLPELVQASDSIVHHTFDAGEGVLIPAEILHHYDHGVRAFVILQPFGCLPNHIVGRGIVKSLRERCPDAHILALDYDPDVSFANIENRLQMLVMEAQRTAKQSSRAADSEVVNLTENAQASSFEHAETADHATAS